MCLKLYILHRISYWLYGISYINLLILANCSNLILVPTCIHESCIQNYLYVFNSTNKTKNLTLFMFAFAIYDAKKTTTTTTTKLN